MEELDYEVIPLALIVFLLLWAFAFQLTHLHVAWFSFLMFAIPQGQILTRVFIDYPAFKRAKGMYLLVNESLVLLLVGLLTFLCW